MAFKVYIDWDNDRDFVDTYDDITADVVSITWFIGARNARQSVCDEPTCDIVVRNTGGKYTPENATSPIYNKIKPNRRIQIKETTGAGFELWNGYLDVSQTDWTPMGDYTGRDFVTLRGVGAIQLLKRIEVSLASYEDVTIDVIIEDALRKAGIFLPLARGWFLGVTGFSELGVSTYIIGASSWSSLETGISTIPYYGDEQKPVLAIIEELVRTERGRFYIDRSGKYILHNRHHVYETANDNTITEAQLVDFDYGYGDDLFNSVRVDGKPRTQTASETLWSLDAPVTVAVGDSIEFEAQLRRETGQFAGAQTLSTSQSFSSGDATVTVTPRGGVAVVKVDNTAGAMPAILESLVLTGVASYNQNSIRVNEVDQLSIAEYGRREETIDAGLLGDAMAARDIARMELSWRLIRGVVRSVTMRNKWDGVTNDYMYDDNRIGRIVRLDLDSISHDARYIIIGEEHKWGEGGTHEATFFVEPLPPQTALRWDVTKWDESYWVY